MDIELVTDGLFFPEGPIAMEDGSVIVVEIGGQRLTRVRPDGLGDLLLHRQAVQVPLAAAGPQAGVQRLARLKTRQAEAPEVSPLERTAALAGRLDQVGLRGGRPDGLLDAGGVFG